MANGSIVKELGSSGYKLMIDWYSTPNYADKTSTVKAVATLYLAGDISIGARTDNKLVIDGQKHLYDTYAVDTFGNYTMDLTEFTSEPIQHNEDGTKAITISCNFKLTKTLDGIYYGVISASETVELDILTQGATITAAASFTDEENPRIGISNLAGANADLYFYLSLDGETALTSIRNIPPLNTVAIMSLTNNERNLLRQACPNSKTLPVWYILKTIIGGNTYYDKIEKTMSIVNAEPSLVSTITPTGDETSDLTGSDNTLIRYYSDVSYSTTPLTYKYATVKSLTIRNGSVQQDGHSGTLFDVESGEFVLTITDSRGYTTTRTYYKNIVNYVKLSCIVSAASNPSASGQATITVSGNCFNGNFGASANSLYVLYRRKQDGGSWSSYTTLSPIKSGNTYTATITETDLDYRSTYTYQAVAIDALTAINSGDYSLRTVPIFDWGSNDFNFNVPVSMNGNLNLNSNLRMDGGGNIYLANNYGIYAQDNNGSFKNVMFGYNSQNNIVVGQGSYSSQDGELSLLGNDISLSARNNILIGGLKADKTIAAIHSRIYDDAEEEPGDNYSSLTFAGYRYGNYQHCYLHANRNEQLAAGQVVNELVGTVHLNHEGKIKNVENTSFVIDTATFKTKWTSNSNGVLNMEIYLVATFAPTQMISGYFSFPVSLNNVNL